MSNPSKVVRIGSRRFDISGISESDPYFESLSDNFEPDFARICNELVEDDYVCADVGANLGIKSLLLAQHVPNGRVIAIEAAPTVATLLEQNVNHSGMKNITVVKTAIGDIDGTIRFAENSAYGHISPRGVDVRIQKLSSLVAALELDRLDFVKIDVEGYEFPILRNSVELLNCHKTLVLFEFNSWCQVGVSEVNPKEFIEWILSRFTHVYAVRRKGHDNYLERIPADGAVPFLHTNMVDDGLVTDLLVTNFEERLSLSRRGLQSKLARVVLERDQALFERDEARALMKVKAAELDEALAQRATAIAELAEAVAGRDEAVAGRAEVLAERDIALAEAHAALAEVAALHNSTSWTVTAPLRALSSLMRRY